jgi:putative FmdB family regulatory protein
MPIYEYKVKDGEKGCKHCSDCFELIQSLSEGKLTACPECGAPVAKQISAPSVGGSKAAFDDRAKAAGFSKLKKLGKGEYEKQY